MEAKDELALPAMSRRERSREMVERVHALLERQIIEGQVKPGERLVPERELAARFGASRNVVRAALAELHRSGKIARRVGHGTVVVAPAAPELRLSDVSPVELLDFRLALEPGLADDIVLHASESDIEAVLECVERGDAATSLAEWEYWDRTFHQRLVAATHNRLTVGAYQIVIAVRQNPPWMKLKRGSTTQEKWETYQSQHRQIADALRARDVRLAAEALRAHLLDVRAKMLGGAWRVGRTD